jgi:hypothetical protein
MSRDGTEVEFTVQHDDVSMVAMGALKLFVFGRLKNSTRKRRNKAVIPDGRTKYLEPIDRPWAALKNPTWDDVEDVAAQFPMLEISRTANCDLPASQGFASCKYIPGLPFFDDQGSCVPAMSPESR